MKLTINSKDLLKALQTVGGLIKPQNTMPILDNVLFDLKPGKLLLTTDNLEVRSTIEIDVDFEGECKSCVPFSFFVNILKGFPNGPVDIIFNDKLITLKSLTGKYDISINPEDVNIFPSIKKEESDNKIIVSALEFVEAVKRAYQFSDKSNADSLSSVLIWIQEGFTRVVGCTKHVFYESKIDLKGIESKLLLSLSTAQYLIGSIQQEDDIEVSYSGNHIYFKLDKREISAVLYDGKYPNYDVMFDKIVTDKSYKVDKDVLMPALKRILNVTDKNCYSVLFDLDEKTLNLNFNHSALNIKAEESLEIDYSGDKFSIILNAINVNGILNSVDGDITMEFSSSEKPCLLKAENTRCLFTPMTK